MRRRIAFTVMAAVCIGLVAACTPTLELDPAETTVEYSFRDNSVPPRYHRSYIIQASETEASITVDSYGDVLRQETAAMPAETWAKVIGMAGTLPQRTQDIAAPKPGCAGGSASRIIIRDGGKERYSKSAENCGGRTDAPLTDTAAAIEGLFDMDDLLKTDG
ncbi:hypothetical protein [Arthrobacter oryzae]|uniref:hypothetical protein n=1 Tax=Arthrobacter oryzae TaxID=409290 RepID=UPI002858138C|nr:hypothetical protein [Arthrobacter oryzae]MDR6504963.1 hypothetical protein [Arthrobacter oryzae]